MNKIKFIKGILDYDFYWWPVIKTYSRHKDGWNIELRVFKFYVGWRKGWGAD